MWLFSWKKPTGTIKKYPLEFYVARCPVSEDMPAANIVLETGVDIEEESVEFPPVAFVLIERLLTGRQVLTEMDRFSSLTDTTKKKAPRWEESRFPKNYYEFLCAHEMADDAHFCEPGKLITKTVGMNIPTAKLCFFDPADLCWYRAYAYPALPDFSDFDSAKAYIKNTPYSLFVEYERYPDIVRITANSEEISLESLVALIQGVCDGKNIPLRIDQSVFGKS